MAKSVNRPLLINLIIALPVLFFQFNGFIDSDKLNIFPLFPLGFIVVISMFCSELESFFWGLGIGILVDCSSSYRFSLNTILYPVIALAVSLLVHYLFNNNLRSCIVLSLFWAIFLSLIRYIMFYYSSGLKNLFRGFLKNMIQSALLTNVFTVILYFIEKKIFKASR